MIEIVYDKRAAQMDVLSSRGAKIPKNIRQIGNVPARKKIYIEDYVMTYLKKIAEPGNTTARGAILLGEYYKDDEGELLFINGAVEAQNLEFDVDQIQFDDEIWSKLYSEINLYFDKLQVVGWFLSRMGFSVEMNEKIFNIHMEYFSGSEKVLFMMDSLEGEDAFYAWDKGALVRQRGYYIYYVRNEQMQNYIISRKNKITEDKNSETLRKDSAVIQNFKEMRDTKTETKEPSKNYFLYAVSSFVMIFALSVGIVVTGSYDKMKDLETSVKRMEIEGGSNDGNDVEVFYDNNSAETDNQKQNSSEAEETENTTTEAVTDDTETEEPSKTSEEPEETGVDTEETEEENDGQADETINVNKPTYYEIQDGDTLMSISIKMYNSPEYVQQIMDANDIKEGDTIYTGQKLIIPYIN